MTVKLLPRQFSNTMMIVEDTGIKTNLIQRRIQENDSAFKVTKYRIEFTEEKMINTIQTVKQ